MVSVFIERLWRNVNFECIDLFGHSTLNQLRGELTGWFDRYNNRRPHQHLNNPTPSRAYDRRGAAA